ncbi:hypothetical protein BJ742DRAFT_123579 [Cladochytrium replicatum]|nr:hypothetical protein BJ742DRAFT_123579 [Cladochytrium replicatum]
MICVADSVSLLFFFLSPLTVKVTTLIYLDSYCVLRFSSFCATFIFLSIYRLFIHSTLPCCGWFLYVQTASTDSLPRTKPVCCIATLVSILEYALL